jgi:arylsulfatase A-like enzyme/imidazolonepropionase-like amidohydrolase
MRIPAIIAALVALIAQTPAERPIAFWNVSVIDLDAGSVAAGMAVRTEHGRITRVEPARGPKPADATIVDAAGKYMIPGLWDSHVHLTKVGAPALLAFVANGVTSVRDMGSDLAEVLQWRRDIESGARVGPRIRTSGQILESRANVERMKRERTVEPVDRIRIPVGTPEEAKAAVARLADAGADFIKVRTVADAATFSAMAAAARTRGLKLTGHPLAQPDAMIQAHMASVEHGLTFPPLDALTVDQRRALFERLRDAGVHLGTTTVNLENSVLVPYDTAVARLRDDPLRRYVTRYLASDWAEQVEEKKGPDAAQGLQTFLEAAPALFRDFREMHAAGVKFLAGSDTGVVFIHPGFSLHGELESLVRNVGLTPVEALRAAIVNPAEFFDLARELGAIRPGYRADLVLLDRNPLEDIRRTRQIAGVMRDGRWLDRKALDGLLARAAREVSQEESPSTPPNILLIQADDLGYGDVSAYGQARFQTPSLDRLAREGIRFNQYYAGSTVCAPSRTALLTGLHTGHASIRGNRRGLALGPGDVTIATLLQQAGYRTAAIGKWGLGNPGSTGQPDRQGFEYSFGFLDHTHAHRQFTDHLWRNAERIAVDVDHDYANDLFTREAAAFIERADPRPFFLYLNYTVPHAELRVPEDSLKTFRGRFPEKPFANPKADQTTAGPDDVSMGYRSQPTPHAAFAAMIVRMDRDIGALSQLLKARGLERRTLVLFVSDNGPHQEGGGDPVFFKSSGGLRGIKRDLYEGGIRVPMIARWTGTIPAGRASDHVWAHWDMLPTLAEVAGATTPTGLDGLSMVRALRGQPQPTHEYLYWEFHERGFQQAVRMGDWKAVRLRKDGPLELYDLHTDPGEQHDIAAAHPDRVATIENYLKTARTESPTWPIH